MDSNFKGLLQNFCQKMKSKLPKYKCAQRIQGKKELFLATVTVMGRNFASESEFHSKKQAEKSAAEAALRGLGIFPQEKKNDAGSYTSGNDNQGTREDLESPNEKKPPLESPGLDSQLSLISLPECVSSPPLLSSTPTSTVSFKNVLQERAQKMGFPLPHYETTSQGFGYVCTVTFNGQFYKSDGVSPTKKQAQQSAASVAMNCLPPAEGVEADGKSADSGVENTSDKVKDFHSPSLGTPNSAGISYKNLLQEYCQQRGNKPPTYSTVWEGSGFISRVYFGTQTAFNLTPCSGNKKQAEQLAAREALLDLGIKNPEELFRQKGTKKRKLGRMIQHHHFAPNGQYARTSWVHPHGGRDPYDTFNSWGDLDYYWEQAVRSKRTRFDSAEFPPQNIKRFELPTFDLPVEHRRDLTVAEIWKEKKNIVIVGDSESSFILYCTRVPGTCNIFNTRTMSLALLEPGCRIIGLDAKYVDHHGKVALQAERCADIVIPDVPDPVLTSCGVVLLYQDPQESSVQVLLKRYLSSQAFVNVAAALAQYFRCQIAGRTAVLDIPSLTEHIRGWLLQEVENIATMNAAALQQVFAYMWKFNKRWCAILEPPLPHDLQMLKAAAVDELARRQASEVHPSEEYYHPWSLPKGNFKHRMLSTGLFIEPPANCAVRELREETGIKLDARDLDNCHWIDLPQIENFYNPHKGDVVRYFLYTYCPDTTGNQSYLGNLQLTDTSMVTYSENEISIDEGTAFRPKFPSLDTSNEEEDLDDKAAGAQNSQSDSTFGLADECQATGNKETVQDLSGQDKRSLEEECSSVENNTASLNKLCRSKCSVEDGNYQEVEIRGIKRKRGDDDDDDDDINDYYGEIMLKTPDEQLQELDQDALLRSEEPLSCQSATQTPGNQEVIKARSPYVQGGVHEECSWFSVEEARVKAPVFEQVYHTKQFRDILNSILSSNT